MLWSHILVVVMTPPVLPEVQDFQLVHLHVAVHASCHLCSAPKLVVVSLGNIDYLCVSVILPGYPADPGKASCHLFTYSLGFLPSFLS